ncbi:MAG: replication initiator protein [Arizlama microvirus]|nr:MAG: replication initiator protein [Arizlama microvirus]
MKCPYPISIRNPLVRGRVDVVPCGKCVFCLSNNKTQWSIRMKEELKASRTAYFITLTYSDEFLIESGWNYTLIKSDVQKFMKLLRKKSKFPLRYFAVGEYGDKTLRPHYHLILFNLVIGRIGSELLNANILIANTWNKGKIEVGTVTGSSIEYVLKYCLKSFDNSMMYDDIQPPFALMSKGIGKNFLSKGMVAWYQNDVIHRNYYPAEGGSKLKLPRYYKDRVFSLNQKEEQRLAGLKKVYSEYEVKKSSVQQKDLKYVRAEAFKELVLKRKNSKKL